MRATIAILLLIGLAQCMAHPVAQESASVMLPLVPRVTEKPTDGAVTDAPAEVSPTPDEFLLRALLEWIRQVSMEDERGWRFTNHKLDVPVNAFRWTSNDYARLSNRIVRLYAHMKMKIEDEKRKMDDDMAA